MKRKIYNELIKWKENSQGKTALLIDGARRVGKSYIVEEFAKNNYKSYSFAFSLFVETTFSIEPYTLK